MTQQNKKYCKYKNGNCVYHAKGNICKYGGQCVHEREVTK
jgi:hypothetical protein